jgi:imidazoleglycerol phosphate dehydratase HisB
VVWTVGPSFLDVFSRRAIECLNKLTKKEIQDMTMHLTDHFSPADVEIMKQLIEASKKNDYDPPIPTTLHVNTTHTINDVSLCIKQELEEVLKNICFQLDSSHGPHARFFNNMLVEVHEVIDNHLGC